MSEKISIPIGLDASGVSADIQKASGQVGKAVTGMTRGISAAMGQSLGPFGELIEKADALKAAFGGISNASKLMAGGIAIAGVAAVYSVKKAVEAYQEMRQAQDEAAESAERLAKAQESIGKTIESGGIAKGEEERARKTLIEGYVSAVGRGDKAEAERINKQLDRIRSGEATAQGEARLGNEALGASGRAAVSDAMFRSALKGVSTADLPKLRTQLTDVQGIQERLAVQPMTSELAGQIKRNAEYEKQIERLIKALEDRAKAEEERANAVLETFFDGEFRTKPDAATAPGEVPGIRSNRMSLGAVPTGYGVGGYTSTGGGGNIYGNRAGMEARVNSMAENVAKIAEAVTSSDQTLLTR